MADTITLKDDYTFLVSDKAGEVAFGPEGYGMYLRDTRYLSRLELTVQGEKPHSLSYTADYNIAATFHLSTHHHAQLDGAASQVGWTTVAHAVGIARKRYIKRGLIESLEFINYHVAPVRIEVALRVGADFADIFEVRGLPRESPQHDVGVEILEGGRAARLYSIPQSVKHDNARVIRTLLFEADREPESVEQESAVSPLTGLNLPEIVLHYHLALQPQEPLTIHVRLVPEPDEAVNGVPVRSGSARPATDFKTEVTSAKRVFDEWRRECTQVKTDDYVLTRTLKTGTLDLRSLMQRHPQGLAVTAGLPWYFTLFGRDSLITALETLSLNPRIAIDTLRVLASYQATGFDDWRDSEPGKILHELRLGDMTLHGEMPHGPYYGSVDSTLLFILAYAQTLKWTDDESLFAELWPSVERALTWAEKYGDLDGDGYIEFKVRSRRGILHQGWKDSDESMGGWVGPRPEPPIALVEVQGYYYAAMLAVAEALRRYGDARQQRLADRLTERAALLKEEFNRDFWWEEESFFAQALDGKKQQVRNVTSNIGHCLWSGIVDEGRAARVVERLMRPDMLCGWGIRTMSALDPTYNPMSYHNGSVWPHDNALAVAGLRRYGFEAETLLLATQIFDAAATFNEYRLPELYCGFDRGKGEAQEAAPAAYPVSCSPQAWAAGTPMLILQSLLGLEADAHRGEISVAPILPHGVNSITLRGLCVRGRRLDLTLTRDPQTRSISVRHKQQPGEGKIAVRVRPPVEGTPSRGVNRC